MISKLERFLARIRKSKVKPWISKAERGSPNSPTVFGIQFNIPFGKRSNKKKDDHNRSNNHKPDR